MNGSQRLLSRLKAIDWDFTGSASESPFSAAHWHPGRFASQVPAALIGILSEPGSVVLDPFAGSGTVLVEAQRLDRQAVGVELNPVSSLVCEAKTLAESSDEVRALAEEISSDVVSVEAHVAKDPPATVQGNKWYSPDVLADLTTLWWRIADYKGVKAVLARFAFSSILLGACRETRHWGYICDNTTPQGHRLVDVKKLYLQSLATLSKAYESRDRSRARRGQDVSPPRCRVYTGDVQNVLSRVEHESVDLVVTSPPYFGVCDYIKAQRLSLEWFEADLEALRLLEIGARSKRHRKAAREEYLRDLASTFRIIARKLRDGGFIAMVVGQSSHRAEVVTELLSSSGFHGLEQVLGLSRSVSIQRRQTPSINSEQIFVLCKTGDPDGTECT